MNPLSLSRKHTLFTLIIATQILFAASVAHAQAYQVLNSETAIVGGDLNRPVTTVQSGANPLNRFFITKVTKAGPPDEALKGAILLLPPLGSGFQNYEASEDGDYNNSFVASVVQSSCSRVGTALGRRCSVPPSC